MSSELEGLYNFYTGLCSAGDQLDLPSWRLFYTDMGLVCETFTESKVLAKLSTAVQKIKCVCAG